MKKSTIWQSVVSTIVIILAVLIVLNIPHPNWITGLLFWQPVGQREIAWHYGADLGSTHRITLVPDVSEDQEPPSAAQMQAALNVVQSRVRSLSSAESVVQQQGQSIIAQVPSGEDSAVIAQALQAPGLVEFIIAGNQYLTPGDIVETSLDKPLPSATPTPTATLPPTVEITATATTTATATVTPTESTTATTPTPEAAPPTSKAGPTQEITTTETPELVYATILNNDALEYIELGPPTSGYYTIKFSLKLEAQNTFMGYNITNPDLYICITLDKRVLACTLPNQFLGIDQSGASTSGPIVFPILTEEGVEQATSALLQSGALPVQLRVEKVERAGSTLGEQVAKQVGTASIIALAAALVFLLAHNRLLGLLADLALIVFGLLSLALCKIIPMPITLANVVGLAAAGLSTLGGVLVIAERLRKQVRAGYSLPKAVEVSFSGAWSSIRNPHLALLLFAITAWVAGAAIDDPTSYWLGVSLVAGTLSSLFATMVFCRSLTKLIFGIEAIQAWLNERKWLLDV
jgi:protein-export membrane protein SecD